MTMRIMFCFAGTECDCLSLFCGHQSLLVIFNVLTPMSTMTVVSEEFTASVIRAIF